MTRQPEKPTIITGPKFHDTRGELRVILENKFNLAIAKLTRSKFGVIRGFHWQREPFSQSKIISVLHGRIHDVCIEVENNRLTENVSSFELVQGDTLFVPANFAHAYQALSDDVEVLYLCDREYGNEVAFQPLENYREWKHVRDAVISEKDLGGN